MRLSVERGGLHKKGPQSFWLTRARGNSRANARAQKTEKVKPELDILINSVQSIEIPYAGNYHKVV
jgi:hypothetical protein